MNDLRKLDEQATFLRQHRQSVERARDAYRQQFDIGQRSLLDLLNAENELFTARRAYANAEHDLLIAQARTLAWSQRLTSQLGLKRMDAGGLEVTNFAAGEDVPSRCPALMYEPMDAAARSELDRRAAQLVQSAPQPAAAPASVPAAAPAPAAVPNAAPVPRAPPPRVKKP